MTNKELMGKLIRYPEDAVIEIFDGCCPTCLGNDNVIDAGYDEENNKILIS